MLMAGPHEHYYTEEDPGEGQTCTGKWKRWVRKGQREQIRVGGEKKGEIRRREERDREKKEG